MSQVADGSDRDGSAAAWTIRKVLGWAGDDLRARGSSSPRLDAEVLLGHVLGLDHTASGHDVMADSLKAGVRVLPTRATAKRLPKKSRARKHSRRGAKRAAAARRRAAA